MYQLKQFAPGALTHLFGEVLYDAVFRHLGADGEASLQLLFYAGDHLLIRLSGKSFNTYKHTALLHQTLHRHLYRLESAGLVFYDVLNTVAANFRVLNVAYSHFAG